MPPAPAAPGFIWDICWAICDAAVGWREKGGFWLVRGMEKGEREEGGREEGFGEKGGKGRIGK